MNDSIYLSRTDKRDGKLLKFIKDYGFATYYSGKKEQILKSEEMIMMIKPTYFYIRVFSSHDSNRLLPEIRDAFEK